MSEYRIHQDINLSEIADEYAKRLQEHVDELALDRAAETLAKYGYVKEDKQSRWFELFGTPERAARTLIAVRGECESGPCSSNCPFGDAPTCPSNCEPSDYDALLEWLSGDE